MPESPGEVLRMGRNAKKKTQRDIAAEIHKSLRTVQKWEADESRPNAFADIIAVCRACGVPIQDYVTGTQSQHYLTDDQERLISVATSVSDADLKVLLRIADLMPRYDDG